MPAQPFQTKGKEIESKKNHKKKKLNCPPFNNGQKVQFLTSDETDLITICYYEK
jgi:hypothetical protein